MMLMLVLYLHDGQLNFVSSLVMFYVMDVQFKLVFVFSLIMFYNRNTVLILCQVIDIVRSVLYEPYAY